VTEGTAIEGDFLFFGYVIGFERERGYFCLGELESVDINGIKVCRDEDKKGSPKGGQPFVLIIPCSYWTS